MQVTLRENGPLKKDVHGSLTVETEQGPPLAIPLHHLLPQPSFQVEPSVLSLGVVAQGTVVEKTFTISNKGGRGAEWSVKFDHSSPITVEPSSGLLGPNHREEVKVTYEAKDAGDFKSGLEFKWGEPGQVQSQGVEITASSSPQKVDFCAEDGSPLGRIDFGSLFFGSSKTVRARLKNLGPVPISYETGLYTNPDTSRGNGDHGIDTISAERLEGLQAAKSKCVTVSPASVTVSPASATVPPFSEIPVEVTLAVARDGPLKGFSTTKPAPGAAKQVFSFLTIFDVKELKRKLKLPIWGQGVEPSVTLTPIALSFGEPGVNTRSEKMLTLENGDTEVPVRFEFGRSAEFHVAPDHGTIAPRTSKTVSVTFDPKVIGPRRAVLTCDISGTDKGPVVQKLEVRVDGKAPATVAMKAATVGRVTNRSPDKKRTGFALTSVSPNSGLTTGLVSGLVEAGEDAIGGQNVHKLSRNESMMRDEHRDQYKTFLRSARMEREERENRGTANPPPPDDALNLGLSSFSGLREPEPELPLAKDPLWLIKDVNEIGKEGSYVRPKNRPLQTNTESEIHSVAKFKARPCEAGEAHECHSQLRPSDIVKIVAGPHSLDFGRVSALSTHAKIFTMTNKLHKSILVGVETRAVPELEKSEPESQVIHLTQEGQEENENLDEMT